MLEYMYACMYDFLYFLSDLRYDFCVLLACFLNLQTSVDASKIHNELNEKTSEIRRLQIELSRREDEDPNVNVKSLKKVIATLEKENANLKVGCILKCHPCKKCAMHCYETGLAQWTTRGLGLVSNRQNQDLQLVWSNPSNLLGQPETWVTRRNLGET